MHGSYQANWATGDLKVYGSCADVEALIASFPTLSFFDPNPRTPTQRLAIASLAATASLVSFTLGGSAERDRHFEEVVTVPTKSVVKDDRLPMDRQRFRIAPAGMLDTPSAPDAHSEKSVASPLSAVPAAPSPEPERIGDLSMPIVAVDVVEAEGGVETSEPVKHQSASGGHVGPMASPSTEIAEPLLAAPTGSSLNEGGITHLSVREAGLIVGQFEFRDDGQKVRVKLGSVLAVFADRFEPAQYDRLANSPAAQDFVDIERLSNAGLGMRYDPVYDEIVMETAIETTARDAGYQSQEPSAYS